MNTLFRIINSVFSGQEFESRHEKVQVDEIYQQLKENFLYWEYVSELNIYPLLMVEKCYHQQFVNMDVPIYRLYLKKVN